MSYKIKNALIVAAGKSSRLYPLTEETPKSLLELNGQKIIERTIGFLKKVGVEKIFIVIGFQREKFFTEINDDSVHFITNPFYAQCNNMGSAWFARNYIGDDPFIYLHADTIFEFDLLNHFLEESKKKETILDLSVDFEEFDQESMKVKVDENRNLIESNKEIQLDEADGEWIGLAVIKKPKIIFDQFEKDMFESDLNNYDTYSFTFLAKKFPIHCLPTQGKNWIEVDFIEDYHKAQESFL